MHKAKSYLTLFLPYMTGILSLLCFAACGENKTSHYSILPQDLKLEAGDIVFRQGESMASNAVRVADRNGCYSHIGIVVDSAGIPMIVHAVPNEPDFEGDTDRVKMDSPKNFFQRSRAEIGEVMRISQPQQAQKAAREAFRLYRKGIPFDHEYDETDSTKMYCTELVLYVYQNIGIDLRTGPRTDINIPGFEAKCYFPSSVHRSEKLKSVRIF